MPKLFDPGNPGVYSDPAWDDVMAERDVALEEIGLLKSERANLRDALETIARMLAPGNRTFDELMRDAMLACDIARSRLLG